MIMRVNSCFLTVVYFLLVDYLTVTIYNSTIKKGEVNK